MGLQTNGVDPERVTVVNDTRIENVADAVADLALYFQISVNTQ